MSARTLTDASYASKRGSRVPHGDCRVRLAGAGVRAALIDFVSTGEFSAAEYHGPAGPRSTADEVAAPPPREIVVSNEQEKPSIVERIVALTRVEPAVTSAEAWSFEPEAARRALLD